MKLNLHTHTRWSDGVLTFEHLVERSKAAGLEYLVVADHDRTKAWSSQNLADVRPSINDGISIAPGGILTSGNLVIPTGMEGTCHFRKKTLHILGLFIEQPKDQFAEYLEHIFRFRWERAIKISSKLGWDFMYEVMPVVGYGVPSRLHFGYLFFEQEPLKKHPNPNIKCGRDAMDIYIHPKSQYYISFNANWIYSAKKMINTILEYGGVPIWAHPDRTCNQTGLDIITTYEKLKSYAKGKPFGMEVEKLDQLQTMLDTYALVTVGNDFHCYPYDPVDRNLTVQITDNSIAQRVIQTLFQARDEVRRVL